MGIGIGLGGVAKGLESAEQARLGQQDVGLRKQALGIQERALKRQEQNDLMGQADKLISSELELIGKIIENGQASGADRIQLTAAINPILEDVERLAAGSGRDPSSYRKKVDGLLAFPGAADPADRAKQLQVDKLEREAFTEKVEFKDTLTSIDAGLKAFDTIEKIPGAEFFLLNPEAVPIARNALTSQKGGGLLGQLQTALRVDKLPGALTGLSKDQLKTALDAAETVGKQRNALIQRGNANQAGVAGLLARDQALGAGAGLEVQRSVFQQARDLTTQQLKAFGEDEVPVSTGPLPLPGPGKESELKEGQVYILPDGQSQALWTGTGLELLN